MIHILYFASLRDRLETESENLSLEGVTNIAQLKEKLAARGGIWAEVFAGDEPVLGAVNQEMAQEDTPVGDGDEVGFFPPVTGG
ncbi:molybdopterin converting factor subunit 1 [Thiolapillus sp.]